MAQSRIGQGVGSPRERGKRVNPFRSPLPRAVIIGREVLFCIDFQPFSSTRFDSCPRFLSLAFRFRDKVLL